MTMPGFAAEVSLHRVTTHYALVHDYDARDGRAAPAQGWGWSTFPTYPGQTCMMKRVVVDLCVTDPSSGRVIWCGDSLQGVCLYPIFPWHLPSWPVGSSEH
jgi:hypothetical protein